MLFSKVLLLCHTLNESVYTVLSYESTRIDLPSPGTRFTAPLTLMGDNYRSMQIMYMGNPYRIHKLKVFDHLNNKMPDYHLEIPNITEKLLQRFGCYENKFYCVSCVLLKLRLNWYRPGYVTQISVPHCDANPSHYKYGITYASINIQTVLCVTIKCPFELTDGALKYTISVCSLASTFPNSRASR